MADPHTFLLIVVFSFQFAITSAQEMTVKVYCSDESANSQSYQYQHNLDDLLQELSNTDKAFDESVEGRSPYQVHGLYLCRGNATDQICRRCVHNATSTIDKLCPYSVGARVVYDYCMSEDSNVSSLDKWEFFTEIYMWNVNNITGTSVGSFVEVVNDTFNDIALEAAKGDRRGQKFATKEAIYTADNRTLYALGQCTPDQSPLECYTCLTDCIEQLSSCCSGKQGGRVQFLSCNIRYEIYSFYGNALPPSIEKRKRLTATVTGATVAAVGFVIRSPLVAPASMTVNQRKGRSAEGSGVLNSRIRVRDRGRGQQMRERGRITDKRERERVEK